MAMGVAVPLMVPPSDDESVGIMHGAPVRSKTKQIYCRCHRLKIKIAVVWDPP